MSNDHPHGTPENVLKFSEDNKIVIEEEILKEMFEHPDVKNRKIVAFSIIGAYRKGKSFFLDYCLRFLYAHFPSINYPDNPTSTPDDWPGEENEPLAGFSWRSGSTRDTTGIVMWNDIFLHTTEATGEDIAIVVMDTQGLFDNETTATDNSRIFALGTLISSIQILNLSGVLQEDQLQYLQFATEFARFAAVDSHGLAGKPFQNLMFLIRDWANPDDHPFGTEGGETYLKYFLEIKSEQKEELKSVRQFIHSSFEELSCALLPHPGKAVAGGGRKTQKYDGNWGEMDEDFKEELFNLIEHLLLPDRLVLKKINGKDLKGSEFLEYVLQYFKLFQSDKLPQAQSIYESTVEKQMNILIAQCVENYKETIYKNQDAITNVTQIPIIHEMSKNQAVLLYKESKKMGNYEHEKKFKNILQVKIIKAYKEWKDRSEKDIKKIEEEKEKIRIEEEKKHKLELQRKQNERKAAEEILRLEKKKAEEEIQRQRIERIKALEEERNRLNLLRTVGIWVEWSVHKIGVPEFAVLGGSDQNGSYYVIRAKRESEVIVGKYCPQLKKAYIPYGGYEYERTYFEVLTHNSYFWINKSNQSYNRIPGGKDMHGSDIYIIQARHNGYLVPGKLHHNEAYISHAGYEYKKLDWSVLEFR